MTTETRNAPAAGVSLPDFVKQLKAMDSMVMSAVLEEMKASLARENPECGIGTRLPANACLLFCKSTKRP
jgi:hypothetical protein